MMERITHWLKGRFPGRKPNVKNMRKSAVVNRTPARPKTAPVQKPRPDLVEVDPDVHGSIESVGPGKNVLIRNRFVREETGTHETLKILDDSMIETGEETGIDPYNTGGFDRSKKWDQRFRK